MATEAQWTMQCGNRQFYNITGKDFGTGYKFMKSGMYAIRLEDKEPVRYVDIENGESCNVKDIERIAVLNALGLRETFEALE